MIQGEIAGAAPLSRFLGPRYWRIWLLALWMHAMAVLPWPWPLKLHKPIGRLLKRYSNRQRDVVRRNLEICLPELDIESIIVEFFENLCCLIAEMAVAWYARPERLRRLVEIEGAEHVHAELEKGKGVILLAGHFTTLEIVTPVLKDCFPRFAFMFNERSNPLLNELQRRARIRAGHESFSNDDVRAMLRSLSNNAVVWYAPDQAGYGRLGSSTVLVPFFGEPAMTTTSTARLARISGAAVVPIQFARRADDSGYTVRFHPALEGFPSGDDERDARRVVAILEGFIRENPSQYLWSHRRFKGRPPPHPNIYRTED